MRSNRYLALWLIGIGVAAAGVFSAVLLTRTDVDRGDLWVEVAKASIQVLTVLVLGGAVKLVIDRYQAQREQFAQNHRFRQDKYDRLVGATNRLRGVPALISANRSVETLNKQLQEVIGAGLELRMMKHQIWSSRALPEPPFRDHRILVYLFESLYHYTDAVTADIADHQKELSWLQRQAEEKDLSAGRRTELQEQVWKGIRAVNSVDDMLLRHQSASDTLQARTDVERELRRVEGAGGKDVSPEGPWTWLRYEATEGAALERITRATFERVPEWRHWLTPILWKGRTKR